MQTERTHVDGNAAAGILREVFVHEMTTASASCGGCGNEGAVATLLEFGAPMGIVLRCPACDTAVIRMVRVPGRFHIDFTGVRRLAIPVND